MIGRPSEGAGTLKEEVVNYGAVEERDYIAEIAGHPHQIMPSHIVITSPYFDTRDLPGVEREGTREIERAWRRDMVVRLRDLGLTYKEIGQEIGGSITAIHKLYKATKGLEVVKRLKV